MTGCSSDRRLTPDGYGTNIPQHVTPHRGTNPLYRGTQPPHRGTNSPYREHSPHSGDQTPRREGSCHTGNTTHRGKELLTPEDGTNTPTMGMNAQNPHNNQGTNAIYIWARHSQHITPEDYDCHIEEENEDQFKLKRI
jgi:hypothetical protein